MTSYKPERLSRFADSVRTVRAYVCGPDEDWRDSLDPAFWYGATGRLQAGDRIEVHSHTHDIQFFVIVLGANDRGNIRCDIGFAPLWPLDLKLPAPIVREQRYRARSNGTEFLVVDIATEQVLGVFPREAEVREAIAALEARDAGDVTPVTPAKPSVTPVKRTVTPGAARTRKYRERNREKVAAA